MKIQKYTTCTNIWPAVQTANRKVHNLRFEINQVYEEEFPAIIPNYKQLKSHLLLKIINPRLFLERKDFLQKLLVWVYRLLVLLVLTGNSLNYKRV